VKYITRKPQSGFGVIIITSDKKGYLLEDYHFDQKENVIEIGFYEKYDIPDELINILNTVQESNIDYAVAPLFQLYYLMKKYPITFIKVKYD
jgi:ABC-type amino acid transport substrate-binding protein